MRSKFFVRAVKRGDYDSTCGCGEECGGDWNHRSELFVRQMISYTWGPRGARHWPASRAPVEILTRPIYEGGQRWHLWIPSSQVRKMATEYARRRKRR